MGKLRAEGDNFRISTRDDPTADYRIEFFLRLIMRLSLIADSESSLYRVGGDNDGLVGENERSAEGVSLQQRQRWRRHSGAVTLRKNGI